MGCCGCRRCRPPHPHGHSWGGAIACRAAADAPARTAGLVLIDSGHVDYADVPGANPDASLDDLLAEAEGGRLRVRDVDALWDELAGEQPWVVDAFLEGMRPDEGGSSPSRRGRREARRCSTSCAPVAAKCGRCSLRTHPDVAPPRHAAARGAARQRTRSRAVRTAFPSAEIVAVEGAGHSMLSDLGERFGELVEGWLERPALV